MLWHRAITPRYCIPTTPRCHHSTTPRYHTTLPHHAVTPRYHTTLSHHSITPLYHTTLSHHAITPLLLMRCAAVGESSRKESVWDSRSRFVLPNEPIQEDRSHKSHPVSRLTSTPLATSPAHPWPPHQHTLGQGCAGEVAKGVLVRWPRVCW